MAGIFKIVCKFDHNICFNFYFAVIVCCIWFFAIVEYGHRNQSHSCQGTEKVFL